MLITKTAWHRKVYDFTYAVFGDKPEKTSLCRYVWRIILMPLPAILWIAFVYTVVYTSLIVGNIFYIAIGRGIMKFDNDKNSPNMFEVKNFKPVKIADRQIDLHGTLCLFWLGVVVVGFFAIIAYFAGVKALLLGLGIIVLLLVVFVVLPTGISRARRSDTAELAKNYLQARKNKVCPIITFEE